MRDSFIECLRQAAIKDPSILLLTGDLGFGVLNRFIESIPQQCINMGIAEQNMTGVAAGLALEGYRVFTYSIGNFSSLRCLEQIRNDVCYPKANVHIISIGSGLGYGSLGMSHHATEDVSILRSLPNLAVYSPSDYAEVIAVAQACLTESGPSYIRLPRIKADPQALRSVKVDTCNGFGADQQRPLVLLTHGSCLAQAQAIAEQIPCAIYTVPRIKPLPTNLEAILKGRTQVITLEQHNLDGGFGSAIGEWLLDHRVALPLIRLGLPNIFLTQGGTDQELSQQAGLGVAQCVQTIQQRMTHA